MAISIQSDEKGSVQFPKKFGIKPREKLFVELIDDTITIKKAHEHMKNTKNVGAEIARILERNLKDFSAADLEKQRTDREW